MVYSARCCIKAENRTVVLMQSNTSYLEEIYSPVVSMVYMLIPKGLCTVRKNVGCSLQPTSSITETSMRKKLWLRLNQVRVHTQSVNNLFDSIYCFYTITSWRKRGRNYGDAKFSWNYCDDTTTNTRFSRKSGCK